MCVYKYTITMMFIMTALFTFGVGDAVCPAVCSCSTVEGYVNNKEVKCSYLGLSDIPAMENLWTLHTLDLSKNELSILKNGSFSNFSSLSSLILSYNKVEVIEINAFAGLQTMRDIDLSYNKLQTFSPKIFSSNPILEKVYIRGNNLVYLSPDLPILISNSISSLYLSSCSLTKIYPVTFSSLPDLYDLDLSSNNLQTISLHTLEKVPDLRILDLNNNPWRCNCDIVEVMQWAESRREQAPAHKPVKCLEGQQYRTLWTVAGANRSCSESESTELLVERDREFPTDMAVDLPNMSEDILLHLKASPETTSQRDIKNNVKNDGDVMAAPENEFTTYMTVDLPIVSVGIAGTLKTSPAWTSQRVIENSVTSEAKLRPVPKSETGGLANLLSWNVNPLTGFVILSITLCGAVYLSLRSVNYIKKICRNHHPQQHRQGEVNNVAARSDVALPLLETQLTADITEQQAGYENRCS